MHVHDRPVIPPSGLLDLSLVDLCPFLCDLSKLETLLFLSKPKMPPKAVVLQKPVGEEPEHGFAVHFSEIHEVLADQFRNSGME